MQGAAGWKLLGGRYDLYGYGVGVVAGCVGYVLL